MSWSLTVVALAVVGYATWSRALGRRNVSAAMYFTTIGLLAGPALGIIHLGLGSESVKLLAEVTLVLVLFADASRISTTSLRGDAPVARRLLAIGLPVTVVLGTLADNDRHVAVEGVENLRQSFERVLILRTLEELDHFRFLKVHHSGECRLR